MPETTRYRIYQRQGSGRRDGLVRLAEADTPEALGLALVTLDADCRDSGCRGLVEHGPVGVLDSHEHRWIILPWQPKETP